MAAQTDYPGIKYRDYARCWPDYLRALAGAAYRKRELAVAGLTTPEAIRARQNWVRDTFWKIAGGQPERTDLAAKTIGAFERRGYRVEKIVYQSRPGFHIPANLYIPTGAKPPFPGVLFQMGHSLNGKAAEPYQRCCQGLARLGYLVLAFDPMGQGERTYYPEPGGQNTRLGSADDEHTTPGRQMLLVGDTATRMQVWDAVRSLDYLARHPMVDPKKLASTGQSGGATLTMLLAAVDNRLAAAAVCSGNTENFACADFNPPGSTDDAEQNLLGSGPLGLDRWDLLYPLAPKPLLISVSARDFFGTYSPRYLASGWAEYKKLKHVYTKLGHAERLQWSDTPLPHGLSYYPRLRVYQFFEKWLKNSDRIIEQEPETAPEDERTLWAGPTGNVVRDFESKTPLQLVQERSQLIKTPTKISQPPLENWLGVERPAAALKPSVLARVPSRSVDISAIEIASSPGIWIPAWLFVPRAVNPSQPVVLIADQQGRSTQWQEGALYQAIAETGCIVCAPDLRGIGDLRPEFSRGAQAYARPHADEDEYAWTSLILGKPLLGQRITDLLALVRALANFEPLRARRIVVAANGRLTIPALFAAALEPRIHTLYLAGSPASYRSVTDTEMYKFPMANIVPGMLEHADLPEIAASISPRRIVLAGPVDNQGKAMNLEAARGLYSQARNVEIRGGQAWVAAILSQL
jgi:dienelactone hydrolase